MGDLEPNSSLSATSRRVAKSACCKICGVSHVLGVWSSSRCSYTDTPSSLSLSLSLSLSIPSIQGALHTFFVSGISYAGFKGFKFVCNFTP